MAVKAPGSNNAPGSRNRRVNRYLATGDNRTRRRHRGTNGVGLAFVSPDQITDSNSDLAQFPVGDLVDVQGSVAQDAEYDVATVLAGQLDMVEQTITAEGAGPAIAIRSRDNRIDSRLS